MAGFVGTSNLLRGAAATRLLGGDGPYSIRPEKIALRRTDGAAAPDGAVTTVGHVVDVLYLGSSTHTVSSS